MNYKKYEKFEIEELFKNPPSEFRGAPFWAWNSKLDENQLLQQIDYFKEMGLGGFHMHPRVGLATEYLGDEFMSMIKSCVLKAEKEEMFAYLYDEDRWPSGFAGGLVTKNTDFRGKYLLLTQFPYDEISVTENIEISAAVGTRNNKGTLLTCFDIILDDEGYLKEYNVISPEQKALGTKWYAYLETLSESAWFNNQAYVDTLSDEAMKYFIEITYEKYKNTISEYFGNVVPSIFTDEPQFFHKDNIKYAFDNKDLYIPWTTDLDDTFYNIYNENILNHIPEIFWELKESVSRFRYLYHDHIAERFAKAFADNCGNWCKENNILLTGHMMSESTLNSQTRALGDCMRSYRSFGLAGIDMLCDWIELSTAKQAQSASHQFGHAGVLSELYGVTNWDFDFRGHKFQGDWQAALGVTLRVHHLSWVSMAGEAKRDYPASMNYQAPWYKEYSYVENHFARVNSLLTRGKAKVKLAVIHPIESYWLYFGCNEHTSSMQNKLEDNFDKIINWLLFGLIDFDFVCESLLPSQIKLNDKKFQVGLMEYDVVLVPNCITLRKTTLDALNNFIENGGKVVFAGEAPKYIDAKDSQEGIELYNKSINVAFDKIEILNSLKDIRTINILNSEGYQTDNLIYNLREFEDKQYLFIAHAKKADFVHIPVAENIKVILNGIYKIKLFDTITGVSEDIECTYENDSTIIYFKIYAFDSILLELSEGKSSFEKIELPSKNYSEINYSKEMNYTLSEENVLLLDIASFSLDNGVLRAEEEILRADNILRSEFGWPLRKDSVAQPWTLEKEIVKHCITLKFNFESEIDYESPFVALEDAESATIIFNGEKIENDIVGYFTDECIKKIKLTKIIKGQNELQITLPFGKTTNTEWIYILGDFGVKILGTKKIITKKPEKIYFGDIVNQGFPFYGANITYHIDILPANNFKLHIPYYKGAFVKVEINNVSKNICYPPYDVYFDNCSKVNKIDITLFGNRFNSFGQLHNTSEVVWAGPHSWRTDDDYWCYEYVLRPFGIMSGIVISKK